MDESPVMLCTCTCRLDDKLENEFETDMTDSYSIVVWFGVSHLLHVHDTDVFERVSYIVSLTCLFLVNNENKHLEVSLCCIGHASLLTVNKMGYCYTGLTINTLVCVFNHKIQC
jgi:hypothetical protein